MTRTQKENALSDLIIYGFNRQSIINDIISHLTEKQIDELLKAYR